jgi:AcrR family transcriptional regulator
VAQVKKPEMKQAILDAAYKCFMEYGYSSTKIPQIAKLAGSSPANIYVYFPSKLEILFTLYEGWLDERMAKLERALNRLSTNEQKLQRILTTMWRDLPAADKGFSNNLIQALSTATSNEEYSPALRLSVENRLCQMLSNSLSNLAPERIQAIATLLLMAFDGHAINFYLTKKKITSTADIDFFSKLILSYAEPQT